MEILTWEQIEQRYNGQWVKLLPCDWRPPESEPRYGIVSAHSSDRLRLQENNAEGAAIIFAGDPQTFEERMVVHPTTAAQEEQWKRLKERGKAA